MVQPFALKMVILFLNRQGAFFPFNKIQWSPHMCLITFTFFLSHPAFSRWPYIEVLYTTPTLQFEMSPLYSFGRDETTAGVPLILVVVVRDGRASA